MIPASDAALLKRLDLVRMEASRQLPLERRSELGQFLTPMPVAGMMASFFEAKPRCLRVLDAGAGIGSLTAALVSNLCEREERPEEIVATAYEIDNSLVPHLRETLASCEAACSGAGVRFSSEVVHGDFVDDAVGMLRGGWFAPAMRRFDAAILNPPYRKISSSSRHRILLDSVGAPTSNLYAAFLVLALRLLEPGGELVAITPRSFCNGPYFRPFRDELLREMELRRLHVFTSRRSTFRDDDVLQENVILSAVKGHYRPETIIVSESDGRLDETMSSRAAAYDEIVHPDDAQRFIRLVSDPGSQEVVDRMSRFTATLADLGLNVSTGRVVDFRARSFLRSEREPGSVPLIHPTHLSDGVVNWPKDTRKPNALAVSPQTKALLVPEGTYVLVKRFSAKEEMRRVVAAVYEPSRLVEGPVAFENHLNYFHRKGQGLPTTIAKGLSAFLNSTLVDTYFRQFSGHTQVNATDLRNLPYPSLASLERLGHATAESPADQPETDRLVEELA